MKHASQKITPRLLTRMALLAALSALLGKFLQIPTGLTWMRISFENLPLIFCGYAFGPVCGTLCAVVADLIGCLLYGYAINPFITIGAGVVGLCAGLFGRRGLFSRPMLPLCVIAAHLFGSVIVKSLALHFSFGTAYPVLALRIPTYLVVGALEYLLLHLLLKSKNLRRYLVD